MKKGLVESTLPVGTKKMGWWITVQLLEDILVLNIFKERILQARHCINVNTSEYMTLRNGEWKARRIEDAVGLESTAWYRYWNDRELQEHFRMSEEDEERILEAIRAEKDPVWMENPYELIRHRETERNRNMRERREQNRITRVNALMDRIPELPEGLEEWIDQKETGGEHYVLKSQEKGRWSCSCCGESFDKTSLKRSDGGEVVRNNDMVICPHCGTAIRYLSRKQKIDITTHFALVQPVDDEMSVVRHFDAAIRCTGGGRKRIAVDESIRIVLWKKPKLSPSCEVYYRQYGYFGDEYFDNKSNPTNRREYAGWLYDGGIEEAFKNTAYENWGRLFTQMSQAGMKLNYNRLMCAKGDASFAGLVEMLFKGRFYRLLAETAEHVGYPGGYYGKLKQCGKSIEDTFDIRDRQKINRIRDKNGGELMVEWMRWSERHHEKLSDKVVTWLLENNISTSETAWVKVRMSMEQVMNYFERQRRESYKGKSVKQVISQYEDYMSMCEKLHKDTTDEMVYRPRELKRRHDEAVLEIERRRAELKAEEYSRKFGEAEKVLQTIRDKFEYSGEEYFIMVPKRIVDIVQEGNYLHHCAGATDRYFDRIKQRETYICFLRKTAEPDTPFYTIEVEPGGTIRQHRGMFDEEPDIESVKPFLREWQKVIRKRMNKKDHELAEASRVKREENIEELKKKNNTRVLQGLMEDFMEAVG